MKKELITQLKKGITNKIMKTVVTPLDEIIDQNIADITTTIGSFIVRSVRGKFQRSISFSIGMNYADRWMEEALYGILYKYNNIKGGSRLELSNKAGVFDGTGMYYRLDDGTHNLKYREYDILLAIQTKLPAATSGRIPVQRIYTIITYDLSPEFVTHFEKDMISHRNALLKIKADSPTVAVYQDAHEGDGYTYWEKIHNINKRKLATIYLPFDVKKQIVDTVNEFFGNKEYYKKHGIAHNLKILLYGPPGPQPLTVQIPTPNGKRCMGDLKPGDEVFAFDGSPTIIEDIREYEDLAVYEVLFEDGRVEECGYTHKWPIISNGTLREMTVEDMIENSDSECINNEITFDIGTYQVPLGDSINCREMSVPFDPWALGVIIGGGYFSKDNNENISLHISTDDLPMVSKAVSRIENGYIVKDDSNDVPVYKNSGDPMTTSYFLTRLPGFIVDYNATDIGGIPTNYKWNTREVRMALLQGIMDVAAEINTDMTGCMYIRLKVESMQSSLLDDILDLMYSLSIRGYIDTNDSGNDFIVVHEYKNIHELFLHSKKRSQVYKEQMFYKHAKADTIGIISIRRTERRETMRCLHVADDMHLYRTSGYIPTCNTGKDSIAKMIASEWNRNLYYCTGGKDGKFIPNAIVDDNENVNYPLFLISDIDKYPFLINEPNTDIVAGEGASDEKIKHKQMFGNMINALDGVLSGEDRIIVMTTNHIEKFSPTFLRPGRVDLKLEIGYVTAEVFRKYVFDFFGITLPEDIKLKRDDISIANLQADIVFLKMNSDEFIKKYVK